jgi:alkylation response protein AidB-like acyl-CoA dehydrogenase
MPSMTRSAPAGNDATVVAAVGHQPRRVMTPGSFAAAERLEAFLGDPSDPGSAFGYAPCAAVDDTEEFPSAACARLDAYELPRHYVPARHGGLLISYEEAVQLMRVVARRDLTVAIGHGKTYLGAASVWVAGTAQQAADLGRVIGAGHPVSWGLTERDHGSDLLAGEVTAAPTADGFAVTGEKWLINNATRSKLICTLVRTGNDCGARGFSLLLIDKRTLSDNELTCLPKVATLGIRGADISGFALHGAHVPRTALVGAEGQGLEIVLKSLQLTRTLCAALSLGAADHALRLCTEFAASRELYGRSLLTLPLARQTLAECYADHLLAEALTLMATRTIHVATGEMSIWSAAVKYLVPTHTDEMIVRLRGLLGARSQLLDGYRDGRFQKLERDNAIVSMFDGNTLVNLHSLINQFPVLVRAHRRGVTEHDILTMSADLREQLPEFDAAALSLVSRQGVSALRTLPGATARLAGSGPQFAAAAAAAERLKRASAAVFDELAAYSPTPAPPPEAYDLARRLTLCIAGAACIHIWLHNNIWMRFRENEGGALWQTGDWLTAALARILTRLGHPTDLPTDALVDTLVQQQQRGRLMSLFDCRLAEARKS